MALAVHRQEVLLKNAPTKSVTLYPSRALVCRAVPNLYLKPGPNEVEIYGITPTADEHSIKVDGVGPASVTDVTVDLVPNKEVFSEVYPDDELAVHLSDAESDDEMEESAQVKQLRQSIKDLGKDLQRGEAYLNTTASRVSFLNDWYQRIGGDKHEPSELVAYLEMYQDQSAEFVRQKMMAEERASRIRERGQRKEKELRKLTRESRYLARKTAFEKAKKDKQALLKKQAELKEKQRIRSEREKYWPKKVYKVTIHLDAPTDTPGSSRRSSVSSVTIAHNNSKESPETTIEPADAASLDVPALQLSYITTSASWVPRYDIDFSTGSKSGTINYRAEFTNFTSETWEQAKVSLSTSQASFHGLEDEVPLLQPWRVGLAKEHYDSDKSSFQEREMQATAKQQAFGGAPKSRAALFGNDEAASGQAQNYQMQLMLLEQQNEKRLMAASQTVGANSLNSGACFGQVQSQSVQPQASSFGSAAPPTDSASAPGRSMQTARPAHERQSAIGSIVEDASAQVNHPTGGRRMKCAGGQEGILEGLEAGASQLDVEETIGEDHGLTTTYEIPGSRTLKPSSLTRRHKIAALPFSNLNLNSIAVPKLRAAAFLRARFRNPSSSVTLLKGTAGLTLDGTFLGNTTLPRVSPNELINLSLGVDPALHISYAKPSVKRSTQGIFNKEAAQVYTRSIIVTNTKSTVAELLVLDQIPVSEDEKLRIEILEPRGLYKEGDTVSTGTSAQEGKKADGTKKWGSAKATLEKNGKIAYSVTPDRGGACRLVVEYDAKAPQSDHIVSKS